jgi:hypothetical protein
MTFVYPKYLDNIILKTFVLSLFERQTVLHMSGTLQYAITVFVEECCARTKAILSGEPEGLWSTGDDPEVKHIKHRLNILAVQLKWMTRTFLIKLCLSPIATEISGHVVAESEADESELSKTYALLSNDKKFMREVANIATQFNNRYLRLIELQRKKI